ncbi:ribosome small subunit-dependent GTPase A [Aquincola sp. S2]|uniref:Small ribosomal subunit biogenesis GTPase RsgA n=1 Tax=Pseudaquabacterium terrae TaxID=2732868 RepID=A0ABX2EHG7_9BURK|nr:ribosome small subunit-dependent GTPase A [Aquabacterium terrae]NRF68032.1 ribosome small subunit-dependent GTPase A [Aquabacterium terrae]
MLEFLDFEALRGIGLRAPIVQQLHTLTLDPTARLQRVVELQREHLLLHDGHQTLRGRLDTALVKLLDSAHDAVAVGDWVLARPDPPLGWRVFDRLTPLTQLSRRTNDGRGSPQRQVLVSNVDAALLVMGLDHDFNLRRLERYLALVRLAGIEAALVLTKADLVEPSLVARRAEQARDCAPSNVPVLALDGRDPGATAALGGLLGVGQTLVLLGSSGAGKSTLTNTLSGQVVQSTGPVREDDSRGRHTTTTRTLHRTPAGACIIDTPGLRALRLDVGDEQELQQVFGDIARWAASCRFRDCRHQAEPGCAVRVEVAPERLRNFQKLQREARRDSLTALERREQVAQWKARGRAAEQRLRVKRSG